MPLPARQRRCPPFRLPPLPAAASRGCAEPGRATIAFAPQTGSGRDARAGGPAAGRAAASGFRWPVRGRVISGFGKKPDGERNDGINLAVPEGTAVKAAEDGTVIYAGNELKSYGNLVLVRHADGWVSAYAHNSELKVNAATRCGAARSSRSPACPAASPRRRSISSCARTRRRSIRCSI